MDLKDGRMVLYRGSLKSCNYQCSYCPFSKHPRSERELLKDKEQWFQFCHSLADRARQLDIRAVMVVPYGEALLHWWYWEGLGHLAAMESMVAVGAQTNLSFCVEKSLELYRLAGGKTEKLNLWATFHPEMTTTEEFAGKCRKLKKEGITVSAGAVGVVENLELIKRLRRELPDEIYLWINKMDGLGRNYTEDERTAFGRIDPYFERELEWIPADRQTCRNRLFVEGNGKLRRCNISRVLTKNWYGRWERIFDESPKGPQDMAFPCGKKNCSCYLAYGGRDEAMNKVLFGSYPLFRVPKRPKAAFLDIDGTLVPKGEKCISERTITDLRSLAADGCRLFFATSLSYSDARKKCGEVWSLFEGGIFAGGGHVVFDSEGRRRERFFPVETGWIPVLERLKRKYRFQILVYGNEKWGGIYKITLVRSRHAGWKREEVKSLEEECIPEGRVRCFTEDNCLQIVHRDASKGSGVKLICHWLGVSPKETAAVGDSPEDEEMMKLCSSSGIDAGGMDTRGY